MSAARRRNRALLKSSEKQNGCTWAQRTRKGITGGWWPLFKFRRLKVFNSHLVVYHDYRFVEMP